MTHPPVALVIVNWNGWHDTAMCLRSLRGLSDPQFRLIVVDNGSTDDSVARLRGEFPEIELLETGANLGFGGGNNIGIRHALQSGAEYVWLLNNDATAHPDALSALVQVAEADRGLGAVGSVLCRMDRPSEVEAWGGGRVNLWLGVSWHCTSAECARHLDYVTGASMLARAQALREVRFDREVFFMGWEDTDLCFRLRQRGWRLGVAEGSTVWHKQAASYGPNTAARDTAFNVSAARFFRRHAPMPLLPIALGAAGRVAKRALRGEWKRVGAVVRGTLTGLGGPLPSPPAAPE